MGKYIPVSCQLHSELELIIMHQQSLKIKLGDAYDNQQIVVRPYNIMTKDKQEFLQVKDMSETNLNIRLDRILSFQVLSS